MRFLQTHKKKVAAGVGLLLLVLVLGATRGDPQLARARELRDRLTGDAAKKLPAEERQALWKEFGKQMKELSPEQREELWKDRKPPFEEQIDKYFSLPRNKQVAFLDEQINRMEAARKKWAAGKTARGGKGPVGIAAVAKTGPGKSLDPQERERRKRGRLDRSTPEQRAKRTEFFRALNQRRQQRGLPGFGFGR